MNDLIGYKIENAFMLPYEVAIDKKKMAMFEKLNETVASSKLYLICKLKKKGVFLKRYSRPQVLYVGETFNKPKRFGPHIKLMKATTLTDKSEVLAIYFLHMKFSYFGLSAFQNDPWNIFQEIKDINSKTSVILMERVFIRLFEPILNEKIKESDMIEDNLIKEKLINQSIKYVHIDIGMQDKPYQFYGGNCRKDIDWYNYNLETNELFVGCPDLFAGVHVD